MKNVKIISLVVAGIFLLVIVLQNTQAVETRILFFKIEMPRAALLFGTTLIGFAIGILSAKFFGKDR